MTPDFAPQVVRKKSGVIYVGIQYSGVDSGVKMTPDFDEHKNSRAPQSHAKLAKLPSSAPTQKIIQILVSI